MTMTIASPSKKRPSFVSKWLGEAGKADEIDETERTSSSSCCSDEDFVTPPPAPLRETSSCFAAWDMTSPDNLSGDEIQAVMIALTAADQPSRDTSDSDSEEDDLSYIATPSICPRNASVQQLPSVGGPEFLVTVARTDREPSRAALTEEDIQWLTGEVTKPESISRQYSIQPLGVGRPQPLKTRQASVQTLPSRQNEAEASYWVTLPSSGAVWKVNKNPDPVARTVALRRRRASSSSQKPGLTFFRPSSRMNGKNLSFVVGRAMR